jgi:hypothetical protein
MDCDWTKIKTEYITDSKSSYRKLAEKYGVPFTTLKDRAKREEWVRLKTQTQHNILTQTIEKDTDQKVDRMTRLMSVTDKLLDKVEQVIDEINVGSVVAEKGFVKQLSGALKDIKDIQGVKSERDIREQEARIRNLERQAEASDDSDKEIVIRIAGNASEYCE